MEQIPNRYPGIIRVEYLDLNLLPDRPDLLSKAGVKFDIPEERFDIPLIEPGTCEISSDGGFDKLSLKFSASIKISHSFRTAFIFYDANGRKFLVGSRSKPFPKVSIKRSFGSVPDRRPEFSYEITHVAVQTPIELLL